jgi:hypothetical protein
MARSSAAVTRLLVADCTELSDLLADEVRIELDDLGLVQSKQEFIASINE